jgi:Schlafen, AlbA_2
MTTFDPREWGESQLLALPVGEFDWLEIKGRKSIDLTMPTVQEAHVRTALSKAVSAFANSGGGVITLGMKNPRLPSEGLAVDDGGVVDAVRRPSTREWLEDLVPHLVEPPLLSFNVYAIAGGRSGSQILPGRVVLLVNIPDSSQAPHQALDKRYYGRVGGKSQPLGHRMVADIWGRRRDPQIELTAPVRVFVEWPESISYPGQRQAPRRIVELVLHGRNDGRVLAHYVNMMVYLPESLLAYPRRLDFEYREVSGRKYRIWYYGMRITRDATSLERAPLESGSTDRRGTLRCYRP